MARTTKYPGEYLSETIVLTVTPSQKEKLISDAGRGDLNDYIRERALGLRERDLIDAGLKNFRGPLLSTIPCGDWEAAIELAQDFVLSEDVKNELDAHEGDCFLRTRKQSMEGVGIHDDAIIHVRPIAPKTTPRRGDAVVVQIAMEDGTYLGTLKQWTGNGTPPELLDGDGNAFSYPDGVASVEPVAVVKGVIWRYS